MSKIELQALFESSKRATPIVLSSLEMYEKMKDIYKISIEHVPFTINDTTIREILMGTRQVTAQQYIAIYTNLEYLVSNRVSRPYLIMQNIETEKAKIIMVTMDSKVGKIACIQDETLETKIIVSPLVDKSDPTTYVDHAVAYVAESYDRRLKDVVDILSNYKYRCGVTKILAPNDGAGVAYAACTQLGLTCLSRDPSPQMVAIAQSKGNKVSLGLASDLLEEEGVFFVSHSESLDPGVIAMLLVRKKQIIAYELSEVYIGYSKLNDNGSKVRSTYPVNLSCMTSMALPPPPKTAWYSMTNYGTDYYVSDYKVVNQLTHIPQDGVPITVYTYDTKVIEKCAEYNIKTVVGFKGIGVYYDKIDRRCTRYFSLHHGLHHAHPQFFQKMRDQEHRELYYVYALQTAFTVTLGEHSFGVLTGRMTGYDMHGIKRYLSSINPDLIDLSYTIEPVPMLEDLHERALGGLQISELTHTEIEVIKTHSKHFVWDKGTILSVSQWVVHDSPEEFNGIHISQKSIIWKHSIQSKYKWKRRHIGIKPLSVNNYPVDQVTFSRMLGVTEGFYQLRMRPLLILPETTADISEALLVDKPYVQGLEMYWKGIRYVGMYPDYVYLYLKEVLPYDRASYYSTRQ